MYSEETKKRARKMAKYAATIMRMAGESRKELEEYLKRWGVRVEEFDWGAWWERANGLDITLAPLGPRGGKRKISGCPEWAAPELREEARKIWDEIGI